MTVYSATDYLAAIAKRQRLQQVLAEGRKQFSGYGLELFEAGIKKNLDVLSAAIGEYELRAGYTALAPRDFWSTRVRCESVDLAGGAITEQSSLVSRSCPQPSKFAEFCFGCVPVLRSAMVRSSISFR